MAFDLSGRIHTVFETKQVSDRFSKRDFVLEVTDGKYMQLVSFQAAGDKASQLDGLKPGDEVSVAFNVRGREWRSPSGEVKYFNTLDAWKVTRTGATQSRGGSHETPPPSMPTTTPVDDDCPF